MRGSGRDEIPPPPLVEPPPFHPCLRKCSEQFGAAGKQDSLRTIVDVRNARTGRYPDQVRDAIFDARTPRGWWRHTSPDRQTAREGISQVTQAQHGVGRKARRVEVRQAKSGFQPEAQVEPVLPGGARHQAADGQIGLARLHSCHLSRFRPGTPC